MTDAIQRPTPAEMADFDLWLDRFTPYFAEMADDALKSAWWTYGRDTEQEMPARDCAAWAAVNQEMQSRGL